MLLNLEAEVAERAAPEAGVGSTAGAVAEATAEVVTA